MSGLAVNVTGLSIFELRRIITQAPRLRSEWNMLERAAWIEYARRACSDDESHGRRVGQ